MKGRILILDDDELLLDFMDEHLTLHEYKTFPFSNPIQAIDFLGSDVVDLVITDVKMDEMTGDDILTHIQTHHPDTGVMMITGFGNINHSVNALRKGAYDYVTKPFKSRELIYRVDRYFQEPVKPTASPRHHVKPNTSEVDTDSKPAIKKTNAAEATVPKFIGEDPNIQELLDLLPDIAQNDAPILIQGESGTGKEVFAHQIHAQSLRSSQPYVKINCANLPSELVESTLFGHLKGSFTGAIADKKGAFDEADGGTLLLDEITEIDVAIQAKLLRVLQENEFYRVGSQKPVRVDVRVLATTNRSLSEAIIDGSFREDLYYRLNVFHIQIPPLRERMGDIPHLARFFADRYRQRYNLPEKTLSEDVLTYLSSQEWRGNVRELDNHLHRGVILSGSKPTIDRTHIDNGLFSTLEEEITGETLNGLPLMSIEDMELQLIKKALEHTRGNQKQAAHILGITDRTIRNKLRQAQEET
ncbi:MAG: sigma-54 dependent transcriptional regulator [Balneolaceae bacterium]